MVKFWIKKSYPGEIPCYSSCQFIRESWTYVALATSQQHDKPCGHTQMLKEALRESVKNYLAYFFPLRVVTPPPTLTPSAENHFAKKKFQGMMMRSLRRSKIKKLILPFDNRFHLTCQGSHFWNRTLFDCWWGHHKQGHMKKPFVEINAKSICAGILGSGART